MNSTVIDFTDISDSYFDKAYISDTSTVNIKVKDIIGHTRERSESGIYLVDSMNTASNILNIQSVADICILDERFARQLNVSDGMNTDSMIAYSFQDGMIILDSQELDVRASELMNFRNNYLTLEKESVEYKYIYTIDTFNFID